MYTEIVNQYAPTQSSCNHRVGHHSDTVIVMTSHRERGARAGASSRRDSVRGEQKLRTRTALMEAALELSRTQAFSGLSLRDVARGAGISPTAFYRHFSSLDDLGVALAEEGMRIARGIAREIRRREPATLAESMRILAEQVQENPDQLRFVVTERYTAPTEVRRAVNIEMRLLAGELAIDLARRDQMRLWDSADLTTAANLILSIAANAVAELVQPDTDTTEVVDSASNALTMAFVGLQNWKPAQR
ncbi:TetR family transcriptional regulator [Mycobacteroides abscessus subsp. abscessus]|nr:TetR family transcriptional regulator [Mycobacteroides abscessus subsp. abscessus]SII44576.1 Putative transcriptional regulator, TetR family [Mycobacteroides abscessus subsp. abscessus]SIL47919.1 Putative transcriptional regulator, TetR family [Mycobacteroides abscessus subsp. abscessus]SKG03158.1 TetR family transcriptional regulator [Mycobacteroides abscessus subsp. abscessus]SKG22248.1 TetR family transcriptional regulator [Mycobacteroides abscessus subsp. abscessus]